MHKPSVRSLITERRSYNRPFDMDNPREFETHSQTVARVIQHQRNLREAAHGRILTTGEEMSLERLRYILDDYQGQLAGRTHWLGGTETARQYPASQFNCSFLMPRSVHDSVDAMWLLLLGCGVGGLPQPGNLFGFPTRIPSIEVLRSTRDATSRGPENNRERWDPLTKTATIEVGDSAQAWAKSVGKLLALKRPGAQKLVIDLRNIRGSGARLRGFGWICSGDEKLGVALTRMAEILNMRAGQALTRDDIHDIFNLMGIVLSSRRSAEIVLGEYKDPNWVSLAMFKSRIGSNPWFDHRTQSNNSLVFDEKPTPRELRDLMNMMFEGGRGEPGFVNRAEMRRRCPWASGLNPCAEILLPDGGFCNLVTTNLAHENWRDKGVTAELLEVIHELGRANYYQTCVDLRDGILQHKWHENNQFLRLCGVSQTGIRQWARHRDPASLRALRMAAHGGANAVADELGTPRSAAITTIKPEGTASKVLDATAGIHEELGNYIFNNINFSKDDPLVNILADANYRTRVNPYDSTSVLVTVPVSFPGMTTGSSAIDQLSLYQLWNTEYADHNVSCTVYYNENEREDIIRWMQDNWDKGVVGVSFLPREDPNDPRQRADYAYLPQEVVTEEKYNEYVKNLKDVDFASGGRMYSEAELEPSCAGGVCPIR